MYKKLILKNASKAFFFVFLAVFCEDKVNEIGQDNQESGMRKEQKWKTST